MSSTAHGQVPGTRARAAEGIGPLLSPDELSAFLGVPVNTIYRWRTRREGPTGFKVGRHVRYNLDEVREWLETRRDQDPLAQRLEFR